MIPIIIEPRGRLGNLMFQYMLALKIQSRLHKASEIFGINIPDWNIIHDPAPHVSSPLVLSGHVFDLDEVCYFLEFGIFDSIVINGWGMRSEYYGNAGEYSRIFPCEEKCLFGDDVILCNVRAEDIATGRYPGYYCMPIDFYQNILEATGKHPVFMGQLENKEYISKLRSAFPYADFLQEADPIDDFKRLQSAKHVCLSISSFAWLAAWLSTVVETIHMPVAGMFDPRRGVQNLIPANDERYQYWDIKIPKMNERSTIDPIEWVTSYKNTRKIGSDMIKKIALSSATKRVNIKLLNALGSGLIANR